MKRVNDSPEILWSVNHSKTRDLVFSSREVIVEMDVVASYCRYQLRRKGVIVNGIGQGTGMFTPYNVPLTRFPKVHASVIGTKVGLVLKCKLSCIEIKPVETYVGSATVVQTLKRNILARHGVTRLRKQIGTRCRSRPMCCVQVFWE